MIISERAETNIEYNKHKSITSYKSIISYKKRKI